MHAVDLLSLGGEFQQLLITAKDARGVLQACITPTGFKPEADNIKHLVH